MEGQVIDVRALIRGVTIGAGTSYRWSAWPEGVIDTPEIRVGDEPLAQRHGVQAGADWLGSRHIVFYIHVLGSSKADVESKVVALEQAFAPSPTDVTLDVRYYGSPNEWRVYGRPRGIKSQITRQVVTGYIAAARCEFTATDPRRYSQAQSSATTGLSASSGGLTFPAVAPFVFGTGGAGSTMSCPNDGTYDAPWVATFTGPLVAPELVHVASGKRLTLSGANLAAGDSLVLDSKAHTVLLNGTASRYSWLTPTSQWFDLSPGANSVTFNGASGAGSVTIAWRHTWL